MGVLALVLSLARLAVYADVTNSAPDFQDVYKTVRENLPGANDKDLNRAAVQGFIGALGPRVSLVQTGTPAAAQSNPISQTNIFDGNLAYLRIAQVNGNLPAALRKALESMAVSNKFIGVVLDLRFANGDDYAAVAETADMFIRKDMALLDWGNGPARSKAKVQEDTVGLPAAILVNKLTSGSSEVLAAVLREGGAGLILGGKTAGLAMVAKDFPLADGNTLKIGVTPVKLGDGSTIPDTGVKPDIAVDVRLEDERAYFADAYSTPGVRVASAGSSLDATNRPARRQRYNEADLVRDHREGLSPDSEPADTRKREPEKPVVSDPVLARGLDLLKGLRVVRQAGP